MVAAPPCKLASLLHDDFGTTRRYTTCYGTPECEINLTCWRGYVSKPSYFSASVQDRKYARIRSEIVRLKSVGHPERKQEGRRENHYGSVCSPKFGDSTFISPRLCYRSFNSGGKRFPCRSVRFSHVMVILFQLRAHLRARYTRATDIKYMFSART